MSSTTSNNGLFQSGALISNAYNQSIQSSTSAVLSYNQQLQNMGQATISNGIIPSGTILTGPIAWTGASTMPSGQAWWYVGPSVAEKVNALKVIAGVE